MYSPFIFRFHADAMLSLRTRYRGFRLTACSHSGDDGLHSASITIEKPSYPARSFNDLDFFHDDNDALEYATTWGRIWIETNAHFPVPSQAGRVF